eukprot:1127181-Pyramimonas_sp.AAC.1
MARAKSAQDWTALWDLAKEASRHGLVVHFATTKILTHSADNGSQTVQASGEDVAIVKPGESERHLGIQLS